MKKLLSICAAAVLLWTADTQAQTVDLQFVPNIRQDTLVLRVQMRLQSGQSALGLANLKFNYDNAVLHFPGTPVDSIDYRFFAFDGDTDPDYNPGTVTLPNPGSVSINVDHIMSTPGMLVGTSFLDVAEVYLKILDPNATPSFSWDESNTVAFEANTFNQWSKGNWTTASNVVLPVELVDFSVQADGNALHLTWTTASETNNAGFDVQYALADSGRFTSAGFVDGHGTTNESQKYVFRFEPGQVGTYRLRLKQVDFDGAFAYGPETAVTINLLTGVDGQPVAYVLSDAAPNPFRTSTSLTLQTVKAQQVEAQLFNALGQLVHTVVDAYLPAGSTKRIVVDGAQLSPGLYMLQVKGETFSETRQIVLVR